MDKFGKENMELGKISTQDIPSLPCVKALPVRGGGGRGGDSGYENGLTFNT